MVQPPQQVYFHFGGLAFLFRDVFYFDDFDTQQAPFDFVSHQIHLCKRKMKSSLNKMAVSYILGGFKCDVVSAHLSEAAFPQYSNGVVSLHVWYRLPKMNSITGAYVSVN